MPISLFAIVIDAGRIIPVFHDERDQSQGDVLRHHTLACCFSEPLHGATCNFVDLMMVDVTLSYLHLVHTSSKEPSRIKKSKRLLRNMKNDINTHTVIKLLQTEYPPIIRI